MYRYNKVKEIISKGYTFKGDEQNNSTSILDWSPNNIRRLIIGFDTVIVTYYATSSKVKKKTDIIRLSKEVIEDIKQYNDTLEKGKNYTYHPIIKILTGLRVMSCIEEIYFIIEGYPQIFLQEEMDMFNKQMQNSRFPRLQKVGYIVVPVDTFIQTIQEARVTKKELLADNEIVKPTLSVSLSLEVEETMADYEGLRPKIYEFDERVLKPIFNDLASVRNKERDERKKDMLEYSRLEKQAEQIREIQRENAKKLSYLWDTIDKLMTSLDSVYNSLSIIYQIQWGYRARRADVLQDLRKTIRQRKDFSNFSSIDLHLLLNFSKIEGADVEKFVALQEFLKGFGVTNTVKKETEYKEDFKLIVGYCLYIVKFLAYKTHEVYTAFVVDASLKYALDYHNDLQPPLGVLRHSEKIAEFCNTRLEYGIYTKAFEQIGHIREDNIKVEDLVEECYRILEALKTYG